LSLGQGSGECAYAQLASQDVLWIVTPLNFERTPISLRSRNFQTSSDPYTAASHRWPPLPSSEVIKDG